MTATSATGEALAPLDAEALVARPRAEGEKRYHDLHPFHVKMHAGQLSREQIQAWVRNHWALLDAVSLAHQDA